MRLMARFSLIIAPMLMMFLSGCQPATHQDFGLSNDQWQNLSAGEKSALQENYRNTMDVRGRTTSRNRVYNGEFPDIQVTLQPGTAAMWPGKQQLPFKTITYRLAAGDCKNKELVDSSSQYETKLNICYDGRRILIDPSHWRMDEADASLVIFSNLLWRDGLEYPPMTSKGYVNLMHTKIYVKAVG